MSAIQLSSVTKRFNNQLAVDNLSLTLQSGKIMGFLGTNGAGKTTTIKMLLGFFKPDSGTLMLKGGDPTTTTARRLIGYMPETAYYYPWLNIHELLDLYGGLCGLSRNEIKTRTPTLIQRVGLADAGKRLLRHYSKGMLQRAGIAQALLHNPEILILDEPFTGLDPLARTQLRDLILEQKQKGKTIFFSSHELSEAEMICDEIVILKQGRLVWQGDISSVAGDGSRNLERIFLKVLADEEVTP